MSVPAGKAPSVDPPPGFGALRLATATIAPGESFGRIHHARHPDALGFGKSPSRFGDPRPLPFDERYGMLYAGSTLGVCFLEAVLRDQANGRIGDLPIEERILHERIYSTVEVVQPLTLVELRGNGAIRMGVPSDVPRATDQSLGRRWALAFHDHGSQPDGIVYPSRLNGETNVAVFGRAVPKFRAVRSVPLIEAPDLALILDEFEIALV